MRIFLSYRREDAAAWAGRLRDSLTARFGRGSVFQDVEAVSPGEDFHDAIDAALARSDVALAVIGPSWLTVRNTDGQLRLLDPDDYVRRELVATVTRGTRLIPVLVGGAAMPPAARLPSELQALGTRQAITLRDETWQDDVERLVKALGGKPPRRRAIVAATAIVVVAVISLLAGWLITRIADNGSGTSGAATTLAGSGPGTTGVPATCPTPQGGAWTDLGLTGTTPEGAGPTWRFEVAGGGYQRLASGRWSVVIRTRATNLSKASQIHYPFYSLAVDGQEVPLSCFSIVSGDVSVGPGESSEALVGFETTRQPAADFALDVDSSGERYRVDLASS
jgi:hypothetical protein